MKKFYIILTAVLFALSLCTAASAAASPEPSEKTIKRELKIGQKGAEEIEKHMPRVLDPQAEAKLMMIAARLTPHLQRDLEYTVRIIDKKEPNAFSLPGGITYFTSGMLDFLKSEDEIAAVMCHEFIHADRAHGIVQARRNNVLSLLSIAALIAATQTNDKNGAGMAAMANGIQMAISNSYSIELEKEADARGIEVLTKAGYNPAAMLTMMERMRVEKLKRAHYEMGIYQTHPEDEERVKAALDFLHHRGINIQRRDVVQALKVTLDDEGKNVVLYVDDNPLLTAPKNEDSLELFGKLRERLDGSLELELAPYDIKVIDLEEGPSLMVRREKILTEAERLPTMPTLDETRERINAAVNSARRGGNMITNYYQ